MAESSNTSRVPPPSDSGAAGDSAEHLEVVNRVSKLPFVQGACEDTLNFYNDTKNSSQGVLRWGLQTAEDTAKYTIGMVNPIVQSLPVQPNGVIDQTLCNAVNFVEGVLPFVHKQPKEIFQNAKERASQATSYAAAPCSAVKSLQEQSWKQVNVLLQSERGKHILSGCNKLITTGEELLNFLLPNGSKLLNYSENVERLARIIITLGDLPEKLYRPLIDRITSAYAQYSSVPSQQAGDNAPQPSAPQASQTSQPAQTTQSTQAP